MKKILYTAIAVLLTGNAFALEVDVDSNGDVDIAFGGTNASTAAQARTNLDVYSKAEVDAGDDAGTDDQTAAEVNASTGSFDGNLSGTDTTVQAALDTIDDLTIPAASPLNSLSPSQGDVLYYNGTAWVNLGAGTSGQFLMTSGPAANPVWGDPAGSGDITAVGDSLSGAAFTADGTGNSLFFEGTTANGFEIELKGANPGSDVVVTIPAATGTLVLDSAAQTLTNKTLTSPTITAPSMAEGALPDGIVVSADIKDGTVATADLAGTLDLSGKTITFGLDASDIPDISATYATQADISGVISNVVEDTTPQLGGNLDIQTYSIEGVNATEFGYLDGVTSDIQTQLNAKQPYDANMISWPASVDATEVGRINGLSDNIMTLLGGKEPSLGNPASDGYILSSTAAGVRSWVSASGATTELSDDTTPALGGDLAIGAYELQSTGSIVLQLGDAAGSNVLEIEDSGGVTVATIDSDGEIVGTAFTVNPTSTGPQVTTFSEDSDNGSNYVGIGSPASNNNDLILLLPSSDPTAGQVLAFGVPSSVTFSDGVARDASQATWATPLTASAVTYENLNSNGDVGTGSSQVAAGDHTHSGYTGEIAAGSTAVNPGSIADGACATAVTATATGAATTDVLSWSFSADPTSTTGYDPTGDLVYIVAYPTENTANFRVCNKSGSAVDPGSVTLNWRVDR